jgi:hypothetical protein
MKSNLRLLSNCLLTPRYPSYISIMSLYRTLLAFFATTTIVGAQLTTMSNRSADVPQRDHPRDLLVKRGRDCGTFTMYCGGLPKSNGEGRNHAAPMACA